MVVVDKDVNGNPLPCKIYLDGREKKIYDSMEKRIAKKWDGIIAVVGREGDGKTTYAVIRGLYLDHTLTLERCVFTGEDFLKLVNRDDIPKGSVIIWDESDDITDHWASNIMKTLKQTFKRIRKKRLKIFLVTPTFFDFSKYFAIFRVQLLFHIYAKGLTRGFFRFFDFKKKKLLYLNGKPEWNMNCEYPRLRGRFTNIPKGFPIDMDDDGGYDNKKDEAAQRVAKKIGVTKAITQRNHLLYLLNNEGWSQLKISRALKMGKTTVGGHIGDYKDSLNAESPL